MRSGVPRARLRTLVLWALPWLLTVALGLALHLADREEVPEDPWATIPFIAAHDLVAEQVVDAIGPLDHLPPTTARAFEYTSHFSPIPVPGPEDWLSLHPERPQTVLDYIESRPNRPEAPRNVIYILPVGSLPAERGPTVEELAEYARRFFGRPVEVMPVRPLDELDVPTRTRGHARQLNAAAVLDQLQLELPNSLDELQRQAAHRAGYHAYLTCGLVACALVAYLRSGVALILAGATLLHFSQSTWLEWVGLACIPIGILTLLFGSWRFTVTARRLRRIS